MWDQDHRDHRDLPQCFDHFFTKTSDVHSHYTRQSDKLALSHRINTDRYGKTMFRHTGVMILNAIKSLDFYSTANSRNTFKFKYKNYLLQKY